VIAHRTSPTNFGLYLLSVTAAADFGWIGLIDATDRLEATLGSMDGSNASGDISTTGMTLSIFDR